jgi:hypothetical protein
MTGPIRDTTGERMQDAFVESPTRANKTAVEVVGTFTAATQTLVNQSVSISITVPQINTWVTVPTVGLLSVIVVEIFDATDTSQLFIDWRITGGNVLEIRSNSADTYTIHIIGTS